MSAPNANPNPNRGASMATKLGRFDNPVSGSILGVIIGMIVLGLILLRFGNWYGIPFTVLGVLLYVVGETKLPDTPLTGGILYFWGRPITRNGKAFIVAGTTLEFDFFPFNFKLLRVDMSSKNFEYPIEITSDSGITTQVKIVIVGKVNPCDLIDLVQVGGTLEAAFGKIKGILSVSLQALIAGMTLQQLTQKGALVQDLGDRMKHLIEAGSFGVTVDKLSMDFDQPESIKKAALAKEEERYQREAERADLCTAIALAREIQVAVTKNPGLEPHLDRVIGILRASRTGNVSGIVGGGNGGGRKGRSQRGGNVPVVAVVNPTTKP